MFDRCTKCSIQFIPTVMPDLKGRCEDCRERPMCSHCDICGSVFITSILIRKTCLQCKMNIHTRYSQIPSPTPQIPPPPPQIPPIIYPNHPPWVKSTRRKR